MSEEKDKHLGIDRLFNAKTNTKFHNRLNIVDADLTSNQFRPANQTKDNIIIPRNRTHDSDDNHLIDDEKAIVENLSELLSAGVITGGAIIDGGSETINVAAGTGMIRVSSTQTSQLIPVVWDAETSLAIPTDTSRHIGIEYNAGSPRVLIGTSDSDFNEHDKFHLGDVVNEGGTLHVQNIPHAVADVIAHMIERMVQTQDPIRGTGLILGESADANRRVTVTAGTIWNRMTEHIISAIDTDPGGTGSTFDIYYRNSPSGFIKVAGQTQWDMDSYDDGSGTLATLSSANKRAVLWFYMEFDGALVAQYGRAEYNTMGAAENEAVPLTAPDRISEHAILIGRLIFQKDTTPAEQVDTVFTIFMTGTGVVDHDGLGNIQPDDHHTKFTANEAITAVEGAGLALASSKVITSANEDLIFLFGRAGFNSINTDRMTLAHRDMNNDTDYAISQNAVGDTFINAKTGRKVWFLINGITGIMTYNASGLQMGLANARITEFSTDGTMGGNSDTAVPTEKAVKTYADTKVTGAGAIAAVEAADPLDLAGQLIISSDSTQLTIKDTSTGRSATMTMGTATTDPVIFDTNNAWSFEVDSAEAFLINLSGTIISQKLHIFNNQIGSKMTPTVDLEMLNDSTLKPTTSTWGITPSSAEFKKEVEDVTDGLAKLMNIKVRTFKYKDVYDMAKTHDMDTRHMGLIIEEVEPHIPSAIKPAKRHYNHRMVDKGKIDEKTQEPILEEVFDTLDTKSLNMHDINLVHINATQELYELVQTLTARVAELEGVK